MAEMCDTLQLMETRGTSTQIQLQEKVNTQENVTEKLKQQTSLLKSKNGELERAIELTERDKVEAIWSCQEDLKRLE